MRTEAPRLTSTAHRSGPASGATASLCQFFIPGATIT
eukprot:COSAG06_NODE_34644_length_471_cov_1.868280_1_plen_36_part_10